MNNQLLWLGVFLALLTILISAAELLHKKFHWPSEQSRKFLHVSGGLLSLLLPSFFESHWWVLALTTVAFIILLVTWQKNMLESVHKVNRYSVGSLLFPIPVYACFLCAEFSHQDIFFYLPISLLAISDTAAEIGGQQWGHLSKSFFKGQKTLAGTACFFVTAILVSFGWLHFGYHEPLTDALVISCTIALAASITELITLHGWDNLTVPAVTLLLLYL